MAININGINIEGGKNVEIHNDVLYVDGKKVDVDYKGKPPKIIIHGDVGSVDGNDVEIHGDVVGDVDANTVKCEMIGGDVEANTVNCDTIGGDVSGNSITSTYIKGDVDANSVNGNLNV